MDVTGRESYDLQLKWWHPRKNPFRFEDLPQELQDLVLLHCIGAVRPVECFPTITSDRLQCTSVSTAHYRDPFSSTILRTPK